MVSSEGEGGGGGRCTLPKFSVESLMNWHSWGLSSTLLSRFRTLMMASVCRPMETAAYSECWESRYSWSASGRHLGSATVIRKSYAWPSKQPCGAQGGVAATILKRHTQPLFGGADGEPTSTACARGVASQHL